MRIRPARRLHGRIRVPGDKSVSHRAALIASLARGRTTITNFSTSADCASTLACLEKLGVCVEREELAVRVEGKGASEAPAQFRAPSVELDCGNSGTTMRLLAGALAAQDFTSTLAGDESLNRRPMRRIIEPLELMGARVSANEGRAPLVIEGRRPLQAIKYEMALPSAQVKSCVLLAALGAKGRTQVVERGAPTRDHTERMLEWLGVDVKTEGFNLSQENETRIVSVEGQTRFDARDINVPGDISSAAFILAAAALLPGSDVRIERVGLNPTRAHILSVLEGFGAAVKVENTGEDCNEPIGNLHVRGAEVLARSDQDSENILRGRAVAQLIDELPVLAVFGTRVEGGLQIRDGRELRVKESDRISAVVENLRAMGAEVEEFEDGLCVYGPVRLRGARVRSFGDHRIAMAFAVAALTAEGETEIEGAEECVGVSFPQFFPLLESLTER